MILAPLLTSNILLDVCIISVAESQGGVTGIDLSPSNGRGGKHMVGNPFVKPSHKGLSILFFLLSIGYFVTSLSRLFEKDRSKNSGKRTMKEPLVGTTVQDRSSKRKKSSSKSVITAAAVATSSRKSKEQKASEKEQKKAQRKEQKPKKKSILRKSSKYGDDEDGGSHDSTHYSKFQL